MRKILVECLECKRHEVVDLFHSDGLRCKCGGGYATIRETTLPVTINPRLESKRKPLLAIELQNESSVPKVFYKGEEVKNKAHVLFDWDTSDERSSGGLSYAIEHYEEGSNTVTCNRIERRTGDHA